MKNATPTRVDLARTIPGRYLKFLNEPTGVRRNLLASRFSDTLYQSFFPKKRQGVRTNGRLLEHRSECRFLVQKNQANALTAGCC